MENQPRREKSVQQSLHLAEFDSKWILGGMVYRAYDIDSGILYPRYGQRPKFGNSDCGRRPLFIEMNSAIEGSDGGGDSIASRQVVKGI